MEFAGDQYTAVIKARIFDIGVVSLIFHLEVPEDISYEKYQNLTIAVDSFARKRGPRIHRCHHGYDPAGVHEDAHFRL